MHRDHAAPAYRLSQQKPSGLSGNENVLLCGYRMSGYYQLADDALYSRRSPGVRCRYTVGRAPPGKAGRQKLGTRPVSITFSPFSFLCLRAQ